MANPFAGKAKDSSKSKFKAMTGKSGKGQTHSDEAQDKKLFNKMFAEKEAKVPGKASGGRLDKFARGGRTKGTNVNIAIVVPGKSGDQPAPGVPPSLPPGAMPEGGPDIGPANPPGIPVMPPGGGGKPVLRAAGGKVKLTGGGDSGVGRIERSKMAKKALRG